MGKAGDHQVDCCLILAENSSFWLQPSNYFAIFQVLIGLGAVIFVHELGHFLVAKACGVKCEKFYVGFDVPIKLFGKTIIPGKLISFQWGETEYGIGSIPLGGYVKMLGQDDNPGNVEEQLQGSLAEGESIESAMLESGMIDQSKLDPRSYLAKSVLQRMAIISAGVIFNLIFAIVFAAIAFRSGVDYEPPVLGNAKGGSPAWQKDLAGAQVIAIGDKALDGYYPFMSFVEQVIFTGDQGQIDLTIVRNKDRIGNSDVREADPLPPTEVVTLTPEKGFRRNVPDLAVIGIEGGLVPVIGSGAAIEGSPAAQADPPLEKGDVVVEINTTKVTTDIDLRQVLTRDAAKVANFTLRRTTGEGDDATTELIETSIPPNPYRVFGFAMQWEDIKVIKEGSPAEAAGLKVGDSIKTINGQPRGDLLTLDVRMVEMLQNSQDVVLQIVRDGKEIEVPIQPVLPKLFPDAGPDKPIAIESLGVAIQLGRSIESIQPDSPAAASGLKPGDKLVYLNYKLSETQAAMDRYSELKDMAKPQVKFLEGDIKTSWAEVYNLLQMMEVGTEIELTVDRSGKQKVFTLACDASQKYFQPKRGFTMKRLQFHYVADNWSDAFSNGAYQVWVDIQRVGKTLGKLVKGEISVTNLGGPGTIAMAATSEATEGTSRLLLFLTFLSANLAIVNFLPIPVLDGGHMVFLAYEGIFRRPVNEKVQHYLTVGGLLFILCLMLFVIWLDVGRFLSM